MTDCIDLSNYSGAVSAEQAQALKDVGIVLAIVQAVSPPPGYPTGVTRQQVQACTAAGIVVDAYIWLWFDLNAADIQAKLALLDGLPVRRLWLDVEDQAAEKYDQATTEAKVRGALGLCDDWLGTAAADWSTGIYTGGWFWRDPRYMANTTTFKDRDLWDSNYDGVADATVGFAFYGGWGYVAIKQFHGTTTLAGVPNVDLNVLSESEAAKLTQATEDPRDKHIEDLLTTIGVMGDDVADSLANTGAVLHRLSAEVESSAVNVDAVVAELRRLRAAAS